MAWFSVRCLFEVDSSTFEERICLWEAESFDQAIELAEQDSAEYAGTLKGEYLGLAQAYWLPGSPGSGEEVFSLIRESDLVPSDYLTQFFDTGSEFQQRSR